MFGARDLAEDGHVVAVKKSPSDSKNHQPENRERQSARVPNAEEGRQKQKHPDGAGEDSTAGRFFHPAVGNEAARKPARERCKLDEKDRADAGLALSEPKLFPEDLRHPVANDPASDGGQSEIQDKQEEVSVGKEGLPRGRDGLKLDGVSLREMRRGLRARVGGRVSSRMSGWVSGLEQEEQGEGVGGTDEATAREGVSPADAR